MDKHSHKIDVRTKTETYHSHSLERTQVQQWKPIQLNAFRHKMELESSYMSCHSTSIDARHERRTAKKEKKKRPP